MNPKSGRSEVGLDSERPPSPTQPNSIPYPEQRVRGTDLAELADVLALDEYLTVHAAIGHRTRYEILDRLVHGGEVSPEELEDAIEIDDSTLHYLLDKSREEC